MCAIYQQGILHAPPSLPLLTLPNSLRPSRAATATVTSTNTNTTDPFSSGVGKISGRVVGEVAEATGSDQAVTRDEGVAQASFLRTGGFQPNP